MENASSSNCGSSNPGCRNYSSNSGSGSRRSDNGFTTTDNDCCCPANYLNSTLNERNTMPDCAACFGLWRIQSLQTIVFGEGAGRSIESVREPLLHSVVAIRINVIQRVIVAVNVLVERGWLKQIGIKSRVVSRILGKVKQLIRPARELIRTREASVHRPVIPRLEIIQPRLVVALLPRELLARLRRLRRRISVRGCPVPDAGQKLLAERQIIPPLDPGQ